MFFSWSGKGYWVPLAAALSTLGLMGITSLFNMDVPDSAITATAAMISGFAIWKLHFRLQNAAPMMTVVDDTTGESAPLKTKHDFCWVPLKYWGLGFGAYGLYVALDIAYPGWLDRALESILPL